MADLSRSCQVLQAVGVEFGDGGFHSCRDLVISRHESANLGGQSLISIVGYRERCSCPGKRIPDDVVIAARAEQDPHSRCMDVLVAEVVVDPRNIEAELPDILRLEPAYLQLDDNEPRLHPVEEQQVDIEILITSQFEEELLQPTHQRGLQLPLRDTFGDIEKIEDVRVTHQLLSEIGILGRKMVLEIRRCRTDPAP